MIPDPAVLLARDPVWRPAPEEAAAWRRAARESGAPEPLLREVRWWDAREAGERGDWDAVSDLAEAGIGEPWSERESVRIAFLHCLSGSLEEAEHVLAQAVQTVAGEDLPRRFAGWCEREGLREAAERFR